MTHPFSLCYLPKTYLSEGFKLCTNVADGEAVVDNSHVVHVLWKKYGGQRGGAHPQPAQSTPNIRRLKLKAR